MRILLPHAGDPQPGTLAALEDCGIVPELADVSGDDFGYWKALTERWTGREDLIIIEQDIVIHDTVLPQFMMCPCEWCVFPYPIFTDGERLTEGLGCTRFSALLQQRVSAAEFVLYGSEGVPWNFLDAVIAERLKRERGLRSHVHAPDVGHLHDYAFIPSGGILNEEVTRRMAAEPRSIVLGPGPVVPAICRACGQVLPDDQVT